LIDFDATDHKRYWISEYQNIEVKIPRISEQTRIAQILTDMDNEINALEKKLAKYRQIKQGMMQVLLTGKIRLVKSAIQSENKIVSINKFANKKHNWEFNEAVIIAVLAKEFGKKKYPLGRKRYQKLSYLLHRYVEKEAQGYLKKAAGPYNPAMRYKGPESIAQKNKYIRTITTGKYRGFVSAENILQAQNYFDKWYGAELLQWLRQFKYTTKDTLELWTTVDMAMQDLIKKGKAISIETVKALIENTKEWRPKLERAVFSDENIRKAIRKSKELFGN